MGLLGAVILFVILRQIFPSLTTILLVIAGIALLCIASLVGLVLFFSLRKPKLKEGQGKAEHTAALLAQGRADLLELCQLALRVKNQEIHASSESVCHVIQQILGALKEQPEDIPKAGSCSATICPPWAASFSGSFAWSKAVFRPQMPRER